jgi:hypothetical protein
MAETLVGLEEESRKRFDVLISAGRLRLFFTVAITVAGIFSSYLLDGSNIEILVSSPAFRPLNASVLLTNSGTFVGDYVSHVANLGYSYARDCYETSQLPERCKLFVHKGVPMQKERVGCPFHESMCKNISLPASAFDTGLVGIDRLGTNIQAQHNVKYRKRTTCAVLEMQKSSDIHECFRLRTC